MLSSVKIFCCTGVNLAQDFLLTTWTMLFVNMPGDGQMFLNLIKLVVIDDGDGILLCIYHPLGKGHIHFWEGDLRDHSSQRLHSRLKLNLRRGANFQTFHIFGFQDGPLAVGEISETPFPVGKDDESFFFGQGENQSIDGPSRVR